MNNPRFILYFITLGIFWGGSFLGIRFVVEGFGSNFAAFLRIFIALIFLFLVFRGRIPRIQKKYIWQVVGSGLFGMAFPWIFLFWAEKTVAPALASLINSSTSIFIVLISPFFNPKDKIPLTQWLGVLLGVAGVAIIFWPDLRHTEFTIHFFGMLAILVMAFMYAISNQWARRFSAQVDVRANAFYQLLGSAVTMLVVSLLFDKQLILPVFSYKAVVGILYLAIFSTGIAILMNYWIVKHVGGVQAGAIVFISPLVAIALDWIVLKQTLALNQLLGGVVILLAVVLVNRTARLR